MTTRPPRIALGLLAALLAAAAGLHAHAASGYKLVVNKTNPVSSLPRTEVSALFFRTVDRWQHGERVRPVDQFGGSRVRQAFSRDVHGRNASAVKSYWQQMIFSGRGLPPPERESDQAVLAYVQANPGAIGYVTEQAQTDEVKVLPVER